MTRKIVAVIFAIIVGSLLGVGAVVALLLTAKKNAEARPHFNIKTLNENEMLEHGKYLNLAPEKAKVVRILDLPGLPEGISFKTVEVTVLPKTNDYRFTYIGDKADYEIGDMVELHWIYHGAPGGGKYSPFIFKPQKK